MYCKVTYSFGYVSKKCGRITVINIFLLKCVLINLLKFLMENSF